MFVLGLQGSPRLKGNTGLLLSEFLAETERLGARTLRVDVAASNISPCQECGTCEKKGFCPIDDEMQQVYRLLRRADIVVMATPVFFYGPTAQLKAVIDRTQALWALRYVHKLVDPGRNWRKGLLLSLGATKGKNLFEGVALTAKYFFDAVGAGFEGSLTYRQIEAAGEIARHPTALEDARKEAGSITAPLLKRKKILFVCTENACRSQMAAAFARHRAGDIIEAQSAGSAPARKINPVMEAVMREKGMDLAYCMPRSTEEATAAWRPDLLISMGCGESACPYLSGVPTGQWDLPDPAGESIDLMRRVRDDIEEKVSLLVHSLR